MKSVGFDRAVVASHTTLHGRAFRAVATTLLRYISLYLWTPRCSSEGQGTRLR